MSDRAVPILPGFPGHEPETTRATRQQLRAVARKFTSATGLVAMTRATKETATERMRRAGDNLAAAERDWVEVSLADVPDSQRRAMSVKVEKMEALWELPQIFRAPDGALEILSNMGTDSGEISVEEELDLACIRDCGMERSRYREDMLATLARLGEMVEDGPHTLSRMRMFARGELLSEH